jgi:FMN phosphatase YigB (HAD superfamily)/predicted amidophosphoribosyltransferase
MLIITDLDDTLIDTRKLKPLRDERRWREVYNNFDKTYLNPDVKQKFEELSNNHEIIIVTSSSGRYAKKLLNYYDFLVDCKIIAYNNSYNQKPHPEPYVRAWDVAEEKHDKVAVFGDEEKDIKPALNLKFTSIAVEWYCKYNGGISPDYKINHPKDINNIIHAINVSKTKIDTNSCKKLKNELINTYGVKIWYDIKNKKTKCFKNYKQVYYKYRDYDDEGYISTRYFCKMDVAYCLHRSKHWGQIEEVDGILNSVLNNPNYKLNKSQNLDIKPNKPEKTKIYFIYYYISYENNGNASQYNKKSRNAIINFKMGKRKSIESMANVVSEVIETIIPEYKRNDWQFVPIPASTKEDTEKRLKKFCELISKNTNVLNGYGCIFNQDRKKLNKKGEKIKIKNLNDFNKYYCINEKKLKSKNVILFDDVITYGNSFVISAYKLREICGVNNIIGIFLGKTIK